MNDLLNLNLNEAREKLRNKDINSIELTEAYIDAIKQTKNLNAYILTTEEKAIKMAKASDIKLNNNKGGILEGIPIAIKDLFCTKNIRTTASSKILSNFIPTYESTVTSNVWNDGAVMLGKLNCDEFAMGSSNETSFYGNVINPWKKNKDDSNITPGGSSGGSAAAVSARSCLGSIATDTGGSIRQPSSFTGTVGIKPTYGRCSRWGIIAFASSLDQAGLITRTVHDSAIMLQSIASYDIKDSTSIKIPVPIYEKALTGDVRGIKIGIPKEYQISNMKKEIQNLWQQGINWLKDAGAKISEVNLPFIKYALPAYYIISSAEASSNLARYDGIRYGLSIPSKNIHDQYLNNRTKGFGEEVKRRILIGTYVLSSDHYKKYYLKAQKIRTLIKNDFNKIYKKVNLLLTPTTPTDAFNIGKKDNNPLSMYLNDIFTVSSNMAGLPSISIPSGLSDSGLPIGLQLIGKSFDEETLFKVAHIIEKYANFTKLPELIAK